MPIALIKVEWSPDRRQLRTFGAIGAVACALLAGVTLWRGAIFGVSLAPATAVRVTSVLLALSLGIGVLAFVSPRVLRPLYIVLTAISLPIGFVVSYAVLAILFYLIITPFAFAFRLMGRDPLNRRIDKTATSYWVRRMPVQDIEQYYHQY
jgi:Saxitoxin biosynthesis operon protein SxtJ